MTSKGLPYQDASLPACERAADLLSRMSMQEKIDQLRSQMLFDPNSPKRDHTVGHVRSLTHFSHHSGRRKTPAQCAEINNADVERSIEASRWSIPVLINEEALHGAQWGDATCFPQSIALAATWDDELMSQVATAIGRELKAVNIHQVFAPVINISRDSRWGRTQETYGEDVYLTRRMALAYVRAVEGMNIITSPKHFVDNYGEGGRDSNVSNTSWRVLREVFLEPFRACIQEGGSRSIMPAYNSVDGTPCTCNKALLSEILREEWGFGGFTVSDYGAVPGIANGHQVAADRPHAMAIAMRAGLDVVLPNNVGDALATLAAAGTLPEDLLDASVRRVLKAKFELGLFETPFVEADEADSIVRCSEHRELALTAARESIVLLKNRRHTLPVSKHAKRIGVFGPASNTVNLGGYSGPYGGWQGDALTPLEGIASLAPEGTEMITCPAEGDVTPAVADCDIAIYFASIREDEGSDRSNLDLPNHIGENTKRSGQGHAIIVDDRERSAATGDQEGDILRIAATGTPLIVVLVAGSAVSMQRWLHKADAVVLPWYGGEQGAMAIAEVLFGRVNPAGRLPVSFPKSVGQCPIYYDHKPTGRSYHYNDDDGTPLFPFGYGLSYSTFEYTDLVIHPQRAEAGQPITVSVEVRNLSDMAGDEVVQLYIHDQLASVALPVKQLRGFQRIHLEPDERRSVSFTLEDCHLALLNAAMKRVVEPGAFDIMIGASSQEIRLRGELVIVDPTRQEFDNEP